MQPSSRTPEGDRNSCHVCGQLVRIEPTRPPGDAPCPHCGALLWFADDPSPDAANVKAARQWDRITEAIEQKDYVLAERLLRFARQLDPANHDFKQKHEEIRLLNRNERRRRRRPQAT